MNRRNADRLSADSHELSSKQRIVRRKVHRSPSPQQLSRSASHREVRTSSNSEIYSKIGQPQRSQKYMEFGHSSGDLRDERLGGSNERRFNPRHHDNLENHAGRSIKKGSIEGGGAQHSPIMAYHDKFEYSLHVCNLNQRLTDGEAKMNLFREFKKYGFVNIKVIGFAKDRHAFINFTRLEDARSALNEMDSSVFFGQNLAVTWSRSTVNRYPHIGNNECRGGISKNRSFHQHDGSVEFFNQSGRNSDHFQDSPRDIKYQHSSPTPTSSRNHSLHSMKDMSVNSPAAIVDPNATRTLFVGNLESDVTERELRDLFSPYGRIESVDIKVQRSISTAYAFVKFFTITDAMNAKNDMHGRKYGNIKLKIGFGKGSPSAKVWVGNLTCYADLSEVRSELDRFGLIRRVDYNNGDNHAFVHFDSLDAAQTAVNSLTTYRFRSSNRPLKIDLSQPIPRSGSDYEDYDSDYHDPMPPIGTSSARQVHSHNMSPEINSHSMMSRRGGVSGSDDYPHRQLSHNDSVIDHRIGASTIKPPFRSGRGRRVVTEVQEPSHARHVPNDNMYPTERNSFRKRGRSPSMNENYDMGEHQRPGAFVRHRPERGGVNSNGAHRFGGAHNGDFEYKPKRPRNGFDAYQYHKLHGNRTGMADRIGTASSSHGGLEREKDYRDREFKGHSEDRTRDRRGERKERDSDPVGRRSSSVKSDRKSYQGELEERNSRRPSNDLASAIEKVSPPPPPPPPIMEMMSYETSDSALKLNDPAGPTSPTGGNQPDMKADFKVETLADMSRVYPVVWHGNLVLKNTGFPTRMHLIGGDPAVAELLVRCREPKDDTDSLRITQRLRLEPPRLEEVNKRMSSAGPSGHCILLALPGAIPTVSADESNEMANNGVQLRPLKSLVSYLDQKEAAGIVALNAIDNSSTGVQRESIIGVLHAFPPCEFSQSQLLKIAPNLSSEPAKEDHVVVLLVKGTV